MKNQVDDFKAATDHMTAEKVQYITPLPHNLIIFNYSFHFHFIFFFFFFSIAAQLKITKTINRLNF